MGLTLRLAVFCIGFALFCAVLIGWFSYGGGRFMIQLSTSYNSTIAVLSDEAQLRKVHEHGEIKVSTSDNSTIVVLSDEEQLRKVHEHGEIKEKDPGAVEQTEDIQLGGSAKLEIHCAKAKAIASITRKSQASWNRQVKKGVLDWISKHTRSDILQHPYANLGARKAFKFFGSECRFVRWLTGLLNGARSRIIVFGSSNLASRVDGRCPCKRSSDCREHKISAPFQVPFPCRPTDVVNKVCFCCSWALTVVQWLSKWFKNPHLQFVPITQGGRASTYLGMHFEQILQHPDYGSMIKLDPESIAELQLGPHDFVIVNHGPAEIITGTKLDHGALGSDFKSPGTSRLFRKLAESSAFPLVMLDAPGEYRTFYLKYAKEYNIAMFDYQRVLDLANASGLQLPRKRMGGWPHISCNSQQLLADAFAVGFAEMSEFAACNSTRKQLWQHATCTPRAPADDSNMCDSGKVGNKISFFAPTAIHDPIIGNWTVNGSWWLVEDRAGKPGWVTKASVSGSGAIQSGGVLSFFFNQFADYRESFLKHRNQISVNLRYMRTYRDVGLVDVYICGALVGRVDAFWTAHASEIHDKVYHVPLSSCGLHVKHIAYDAMGFMRKFGSQELRVDVVHVIPNKTDRLQGSSRETFKFKIEGVDVCVI